MKVKSPSFVFYLSPPFDLGNFLKLLFIPRWNEAETTKSNYTQIFRLPFFWRANENNFSIFIFLFVRYDRSHFLSQPWWRSHWLRTMECFVSFCLLPQSKPNMCDSVFDLRQKIEIQSLSCHQFIAVLIQFSLE